MQDKRNADPEWYEPFRLSTVDNFQGEEADVVIVSLVRSNRDNKIGFMNEARRVNVLLSRARHGLVLVGNDECLKAGSKKLKTWDTVLRDIPIFDSFPQSGGSITTIPGEFRARSLCMEQPH